MPRTHSTNNTAKAHRAIRLINIADAKLHHDLKGAESALEMAARWAKLAGFRYETRMLQDMALEVRIFEATPTNWERDTNNLRVSLGGAEIDRMAA